MGSTDHGLRPATLTIRQRKVFRRGQDGDHGLFQRQAGRLPGIVSGAAVCYRYPCLCWVVVSSGPINRVAGILIPGPVRSVLGVLIPLESRQESAHASGIGGTMQELAIETIDRYDAALLTIDNHRSDLRARSHGVVAVARQQGSIKLQSYGIDLAAQHVLVNGL